MKIKLLSIVSAVVLTISVGIANAKPVQLTPTQMDKVSAGTDWKDRRLWAVNALTVTPETDSGKRQWLPLTSLIKGPGGNITFPAITFPAAVR